MNRSVQKKFGAYERAEHRLLPLLLFNDTRPSEIHLRIGFIALLLKPYCMATVGFDNNVRLTAHFRHSL
jgi:hypothetical protein